MIHKPDFHTFSGLIRNIAIKFRESLPETPIEDIEQELWVKLIKSYQTHKTPCGRHWWELDTVEQIKLAKTTLKRKAIDLTRSRKRSLDPAIDNDVVMDACATEDHAVRQLIEVISKPFMESEQDMLYKDLHGLILLWLRKQSEPVQLLIREKLNPSEETQEKWGAFVATHHRYKNYETIPGTTLCGFLGLDAAHWYKAMRSLRGFLQDNGYSAAM